MESKATEETKIESPDEKIIRLESEVEKSKKSIILETQKRGELCFSELQRLQIEVLKKYNCALSPDGKIIANAF